ncbi:MAG TPA: NADH-quinone oxidoreductase subunit NuoE [Candidatus Thiothrix moscowensis]|uniref:NADH-quinone oxidoreductase subunit NuoE family protein n=1 Tax=unclassified Thiothrix TaxID=2636184 RepID=UPI0025E1E387|nr:MULTISPECIES: NADH-quinone oxidoreductase subunit NuoE [unclassified Thiothrix]HRJ53355.1 NADH-quinone oxidoreductase subunit NuoE [Candidatus Thiothrix moscowensis]HRJ94936.1 NADH-quinone oxidoreductase subunit NuoE [Candidatus Thiothrix moscowensis]
MTEQPITMLKRKRDLLSHHERDEIDAWLKRYPDDKKQSALLAALRAVMHEDHYLSREKMDAVADYLGLPEIAVYEVASFYSMYELDKKSAAKYSISVCTNVSCMLCGSDEILSHIENKLGIKLGEASADGKFFLKMEEECLAACSSAPMIQVNHVYHTHLTPAKVDEILDGLE